MYQAQRLEKMLELLNQKGKLASKDMVDYFQVSKDTIRRDFSVLAVEGKVRRTHGGIMRLQQKSEMRSFDERLLSFTEEKQKIAKLALKFIEKEGVYFFDVSTIVLKLAQLVDEQITIYSHSLDNAIMMSTKEKIDFHLLGGKFFQKNRFYYAINEAEILKNLSFDIVFIGAGGLKAGEVTFADQADCWLKKMILKNAKIKILLAENSKFEIKATYSVGKIADFDYLITDKKPDFTYSSPYPKIIYSE